MSFVHEIFHAVKCDRCGELHEDSDYTYYTDEQSAEEQAMENDWICLDGKHYCPCCYTEDEDGENTPLPHLPHIYWTARSAMKKLSSTPRILYNEDNTMTVSCSTGHCEDYVKGVEAWIRAQSSPGAQYSIERHYEGKAYPHWKFSVTIKL